MAIRTRTGNKAPPGWGFAFAVFLVLGLGATAMALLSHKQQTDSDRFRFNEETRLVDNLVEGEIEDAFLGVAQVAAHLAQTIDSSSPADFQQFLERSEFEHNFPALRTGVIVIELVPADELDAFEAREQQYDPDFEVTQMVEGYNSPTSWVLTRASNAEGFGVDLFGADIAQLSLALPGYLPTEEKPVSVLPLSAFAAISGAAADPAWENLITMAATGQFRQIVMSWIPGDNGEAAGLLLASLNDATLLDELDSKFRSSIKVHVQLLTEEADARPVPAADRATHSAARELTVEGTRWHITTWAGPNFATTDLRLAIALSAIGWIFACIIAVGLLLRYRGLGELEVVQQELQVTSELAGSDPLTGLINRAEMLTHIHEAIDNGNSVGVLFMDMDRFKLVNDTLGHDAGDELLKAVAQRVSVTVRNTDWVARFGGDEFVILLNGVKTITEATATAQAIQASVQEPLKLGNTLFHPAASIGVAIAGDSMFVSPAELLRQADTAMYAAKRSQQTGIAVFDSSMQQAAVDRLSLEQDLYEAVSESQLVCQYQPIVDSDGNVVANEALAFWDHPERGRLALAEFYPIARQVGLIGQLTSQALIQVCVELSQSDGLLPVHLNVDAHVLADPEFGNRVQVILTQSGTNPGRLVLEVEEEGLSAGQAQVKETMKYLSNYGVRFAVDEFGKGQTSLSLFTRYEALSIVKIDKEMVTDALPGGKASPVITAIVAVARSFDLTVAADGITSAQDHQYLMDLGVEWAQGSFHGEPQPAPVSSSRVDRQS